MGDFKINEKTVFTQSGGGEPAMGSPITDIPAAGLTGTIPSGVVFPANHATNTLVWKLTEGDFTGIGSIWDSADVSFSAVSGKTYEITTFFNSYNYGNSATARRDGKSRLYVLNSATAQSTYLTTGTLLANASWGRILDGSTSADNTSYHYVNLIGYFVCGTTRTEYIRVNTEGQGSEQTIVSFMSATSPAWVIVREFPTLTITAVT